MSELGNHSENELIAQVLDSLKTKVSEFNYNNWFKNSSWSYEGQGVVKIQVPSKFVRDWICEHYLQVIKFECFKLTGIEHDVVFKIQPIHLAAQSGRALESVAVTEKVEAVKSLGGVAASSTVVGAPSLYPQLNPRYTFDNYVVGNSNQFVNAACRAVVSNPARNYNPLFIYGGVGLGKTHLLNAICLEILKTHPGWKIRLVTGEQFTNEVVSAIRYQKTYELRQKYRVQCDLLLIDDVQFIAGKERTMEEFFHTFNALYEARKQIVMTSDVLPKDIPNLEERLRSRFSWGLMADIQAPELETRMAILEKKAEVDHIRISSEVSYFIAEQVKSNVRDLEGCLVRLAAMASLSQMPITMDLAREMLKQTLPALNRGVSIETIQQMVAQHFQLRINDLKSPRRHKNLALPRQIAMYLCKKHVKASFPEIGQKFGGKDHTTVIHAFQKIKETVNFDLQLRENIDFLEKQILHQA